MRRPTLLALGTALALAGSSGCAGSKKLDERARAASTAPEAIAWTSARRDDVLGYFESERITGDAAAALRRVSYVFAPDGTYSGAALVADGAHSTFQVLAGTWSLTGDTLSLGTDTAPARVFAAPDRLRLDADGGSVVLRRGKLQ